MKNIFLYSHAIITADKLINRVHGSKETIHYYFIKCPRMHEAGRGGAGGDGVERGFEDSNSTFLRKSVR